MATNNMKGTSTSHSSSSIQRLLIFHLNLAEKCLGESLGEGASIQELSQSILYYHREGNDNGIIENEEEPIQFLGLCTALLTLPSSLGGEYEDSTTTNNNNEKEDMTNEIYFGNSTLVFVTLELSQELITVAQITRGGNPYAVRVSIERCHNLFSMLHGGGVLRRLAAAAKTNQDNTQTAESSPSCPYPHMDTLFNKLKLLRKASEKRNRNKPDMNNDPANNKKIQNLRNEIEELKSSLPIHSIRCDLDAHYKQYIGDLSIVIGRNAGAARCIVETVPVPIPQDSGNHVTGSLPSALNSYVTVSLGLAIRGILREFQQIERKSNEPALLGISAFYQGKLLYTHFNIDQYVSDVTVPKELVCLLMWYMASYRIKMKHLASTTYSSSNHPPGTPPRSGLGLNGLTLSFGSLADESTRGYNDPDHMVDAKLKHPRSTSLLFLPPPPLFMLSSSEHSHSFDGPDQRKIWAPKVHLPLVAASSNEGTNEMRHLDTHVMFCQQDDFNFLIYVGNQTTGDDEAGTMSLSALFLDCLGESIGALISESRTNAAISTTEQTVTNPMYQSEPGQDIIHIDRFRHHLTLISDRKQVAVRQKTKSASSSSSTRSPPRRFLGFGPRRATENNTKNTPQQQPTASTGLSEWSVLGLDCRHLLASQLHLDTILAFDDMMNEVAKARRKICNNDDSSNKLIELCTCLPLGWMYAFADGHDELYAFFDSSIYVTVADVQCAALKLQQHFFGRWTDKSNIQKQI